MSLKFWWGVSDEGGRCGLRGSRESKAKEEYLEYRHYGSMAKLVVEKEVEGKRCGRGES